jgi:NAD(P)-dependent dehydrogenase (short-subunit alcohol dehydrogenase family)
MPLDCCGENNVTATDDTPVPDYAGLLRLDGRNLIVVGAGQGMGRQSSHAFKQLGANVVCVDVDEGRADDIASEVGGIAFAGDMTKESEVQRLVATAAKELGGPISGFVDIVGIAEWSATIDTGEDSWDRQLDINIRHDFLLGKHIGKHMVDNGVKGTMVFIASVHGLMASTNHAAYGVAKAGVISLTRTFSNELGPHGIRANAIAPGSVKTQAWTARVEKNPEIFERLKRWYPLGDICVPDDIAGVAAFLVGPDARMITGAVLPVDGGLSVGSTTMAREFCGAEF